MRKKSSSKSPLERGVNAIRHGRPVLVCFASGEHRSEYSIHTIAELLQCLYDEELDFLTSMNHPKRRERNWLKLK